MLMYVGGIRWNKILEWLLCTLSCDDHYYSLVVGELPSRVMQKCPGTQIQMMVACLCPITRNERDSLAYMASMVLLTLVWLNIRIQNY